MLRPEKAEMLCAALVDRLGIAKLDTIDGRSLGAAQMRQMAMDDSDWYSKPKTARDMYEVRRGVATIAVSGTTVHKLGGVEPYSGMVGYDCLDRIITDAIGNEEVGAIMLDIDSPGGEVSGCFDFARKLRGMAAKAGGPKPIVAFANEMACSAAYAIAASCDAIATTNTGITGSIGVWTMLVDMTKGLQKGGIEVTMIRAGQRKARGGPYEAADAETFDKLQSWVDETWDIFAAHVADGRPISKQQVFDLEGDWFTGQDAIDLGLVDVIDSSEAIFEAVAQLAR
ncbi:UNVERIFIED_ORG: signal peptide peptidase SppA [Sphingomonas sp. R1F5B]